MKRKLLSGILVICMILSMLPVTAFADETPGETPHEHDYTKLIGTLKAPTCSKTGIGQYQCSCGEKTYLTMPAAHKEPAGASQITTVEPTCVDAGSKTYVCAECGEPVKEILPATGEHDFQQGYKEATCTKGQIVGFICTVCGKVDESQASQELPNAKGHDFVLNTEDESYKAATCGEDGLNVYVCQREDCDEGEDADGHGKTYEQAVDALGHDWDDGVAVEASCASAAGVKKTCQREGCGATSFEAFTGALADPQKEHTWADAPEIKASCETETDGRTGGQWCSVCHTLGTGSKEDGGNGGAAPIVENWSHTQENKTVTIKPATCEEGGIERTDSVCTVCEKTLTTGDETPTAKLEGDDAHTKELSGKPLKAATCTAAGIGQYVCSVCGKNLGYLTIPKADHTKPTNPGSVVTVPSTCQTAGSETYTCTVCKEEVKVELELADHDFSGTPVYTAVINGNTVELTAACTCVDVTKTWTCATEDCGETKTETVKATGDHDYDTTYDESDCTVGTIVYEACTVCGTAKDKGQNLGDGKDAHKWVLDKTNPNYKAATCKEAGVDTFKCGNGNCEATKETDTQKLDHSWDTGVFIEATCDHNAGTRQTCTVPGCGEIQEVYFSDAEAEAFGDEYKKQGHSYSTEAVAEVAATCTECNKEQTETIPALGHDYSGEPVYSSAFTCEDRTATYTCANGCGKTKTETVKATAEHEYEAKTTPATCTAPEQFGYICKNCGAVKGKMETVLGSEALAHDFDKENPIKTDERYAAATCTKKGTDVYKCRHCDELITELTDSLGHDYGEGILVEPTCKDGNTYVVQTCQRADCKETDAGHELKTTIIESETAGAHKLTATAAVAATCTEDGNIAYWTCSVCKKVFSDAEGTKEIEPESTVVKAEHDYEVVEEVAATCTKAAHSILTCKVCDEGTEGHTLEVPGEDTTLAPHVPNGADLTGSNDYQNAACGDTVTFKSFTCENCGEEITPAEGEDSISVIKAHVYNDGEITTPATCQAAGVKTYTCTNSGCTDTTSGHTKTEEIAKLEHTFPTVTRPADWPICKDYTTTITCSACKEGEDLEAATKEVTLEAAADHDYEESFVGEGEGYDCTKGVYAGSICKICHEPEEGKGNYLPGTKYDAHDFVIDAGQDINCEAEGEYAAHCSRCSAKGTVTVDGTGHKFADDDKGTLVDATCTENGKLMKTCTVCGQSVEDPEFNGAVLAPAGHAETLTILEIPENCENQAATIQYCPNCLTVNETTGEVISGTPDEGILSVENVMVGEKEPGPATKYTVEVTEPQNGTLTVKVGGQDISSEGHDEDSDVVITAKPDMGYRLLELKVNNGAVKTDIVADGTYTYTFKLKQNTTISATFEPIPKDKYSLTVNAAPTVGGTATGNAAQLEAGAKAIVTIKPSDGYTIGIVTNNGVAVESTLIKEGEVGSCTYEFTMPADNVAINVIFVHVKVAYNPVSFGEIPENASAVKNSTIDAEQLAADEEANKEIADVIKNLEGESKVTVYFEMAVKSYEESTKILKLDITPMYKAGEGEAKALKAQITSPVEITISLPDAFKDVAKVYVIHKNNVTPADVKEGKVEFTNKDGFSEFTITASDPRHTITFDANGGSVTPTSATTRGDETLESLPVPTRSNYKFDGWFTAKDGGTKVTTSSKFTQNATIYAHWTYNGGSSGGSSSSGGGGSSYHGGGSSGTTYAITTQGGASNGSVSLNPNRASKGKTVTITVRPDEGYELEALTVTDAKGSELTLTDKGDNKYTFTVPSSAVSVAASFKAVSSDGTPVQFTDVPADKFCYDAVQWAVENGITNGHTRTTFNPNGTCTRAQMVTFLWRAAGAPAVTGAMSFTDIAPDAYYYQAVLWAVQQGITTGTTDTAFNPDGIVNRAQTVTFLYRMLAE